jgi:hypothetical protein
MTLRALTWAALLNLIPAAAGLGIWIVLASVSTPSLAFARESLAYMLNDAPNRNFFRWW